MWLQKLRLCLLLFVAVPTGAWANAELVQIVGFAWEADKKALQLVSLGSGTAIAKNVVITNKHVVALNGGAADFLLLCPADSNESRSVNCSVPAGVSALHETLDVALVKPIDPKTFLLSVRTTNATRSKDDIVRIVGFPVPEATSAQNFGGTKTLKAFEAWQSDPEKGLVLSGDSPTTTRGKVLARYRQDGTDALYTYTDAKVNFGNSGGAAFDQFGSYIGIPTLKDQLGNSFILEYGQVQNWVAQHSQAAAEYEALAYNYYQGTRGKMKEERSAASARLRYYQQLRARQSLNRSGSVRRTYSRRYSRNYYRSRY